MKKIKIILMIATATAIMAAGGSQARAWLGPRRELNDI